MLLGWQCAVWRRDKEKKDELDIVGFPLEFYNYSGIAFTMDDSTPIPLLRLETVIDEIIDLGDGWYYWHGVRYPGNLDKGKKPIVFDD